MKLSMFAFRSWSIRWQIGCLLVAAQLAANIITATIANGVFTGTRIGPEAAAMDVVGPFLLLVKVIERLGAAEADVVIRAAVAADPRLSIKPTFASTTDEKVLGGSGTALLAAAQSGADPKWRADIGVELLPGAIDRPWADLDFAGHLVGVRVGTEGWLVFSPSNEGMRQVFPLLIRTLAILVLVLPLAGAAFWATWALVAPLARLAREADRFSRDLDATPIVPTGSVEIRKVGESFNLMRARIKAVVEARARAMAAISHDLRTPLTRMRLRVEMLPGSDERDALLADVHFMETMTHSVLAHLRDQQSPTAVGPVDLAALMQTICDEFAEQGHDVSYAGPDRKVIACDAARMRRCLSNLVENAVVHGGCARVRLTDLEPNRAVVTIKDRGPGIAAVDREALFEPFRRGDAARSSAGFGLGLSIAREIVERHGGIIELADNEPHGLIVRLILPVTAECSTVTAPVAVAG